MSNWFIYVWMGFFALSVLGLIAFLLPRQRSSSKFWLSLIADHFTLKVTLTPAEVHRRLATTSNLFTHDSYEPLYMQQWVTNDAFRLDRFTKSRLVSAQGEIWPHPEGALINVSLHAYDWGVVLLPILFVLNLLCAFSSLTFLALALGVSLLIAGGYFYLCLTEIRQAKTFLTTLLNAMASDELPPLQPSVAYQEPLLFDKHAELEKYKDSLILTYPARLTGFTIFLLITSIGVAGVLCLSSFFFTGRIGVDDVNQGILLVIFLLLFCGSLVLLYYALASWFNRTVITLTRQTLSVRYQPIPTYGNITVPTAELKQLYPKRVILLVNKGGGAVLVTYELRAILKNNKQITLLEFNSPEEVLYTKQQIEAWLRLNGYVLEASPQ